MLAIQLQNIQKTFILPHQKQDSLKEHFINIFHRKTYEHFKALENINLTVEKGDFYGIVGKNGSGKSTLLKIIAGIYKPNKGELKVNGKIAPFLELGIGFQPELTARENIFLNATLLGLDRSQIKSKFKKIVDFAEIEKFLDLKVKNFSSGMHARLAFAIAIEADADIYLCDEVLAVGDEGFQKKCLQVFEDWKKQGKTIVLVSHNSALISQFCNKIALLEKGIMIDKGAPKMVLDRYHTSLFSKDHEHLRVTA